MRRGLFALAAALTASFCGAGAAWAAGGSLALDLSSSFTPARLDVGSLTLASQSSQNDLPSATVDGLLSSSALLNSVYAPLALEGQGGGGIVSLGDKVNVDISAMQLDPRTPQNTAPSLANLTSSIDPQYGERTAAAGFAGVSWNFASWGGLGIEASESEAQAGLFGGANAGALSLAKSANTSAVGTTVRLGLGGGWVTTVSYSQGITNLDLKSANFDAASEMLSSKTVGLAITKRGVFDGDNNTIGFAISRPIQVYSSGNTEFVASNALSTDGSLAVGHLLGQSQETDLSLGYVTSFMNGALALQANAGYQMNMEGQPGQNGISFISRAKINF